MTSLKQLAIRGAIWTIASYGFSQIIRFGGNLILTRLLAPQLFGLMTLVTVFIVGLNLFSDVGVGPSVVRSKRGDDPDFLNTAWTIQVIRSFIIWGFCILIAFPISRLYNEPQLLWLIPIVGFGGVISGFSSTAGLTLERHMEMRRSTLFSLGGQVLSIVILIVWAKISPTIWALVLGNLLTSLVSTIWSYYLIPGTKNRFAWDAEAVQDLFGFGQWIFLSTAVTFLAEQVDRLMLGKLIALETLGVYGVAYALADIPRQVLAAVSSRVFFPTFSKMVDQPRDVFLAKILKNRLPLLLVSALSLTVLVGAGDFIITLLYDRRYAQASWMLPIMALGIWPRVLTQTIDQVFFALGQPRYPAYGCIAKFVFMLIALPTGFHFLGIAGAVIAVSLNDLPFYLVVIVGLQREKLSPLKQDLQATLVFVGLVALVLLGRSLLSLGSPFQGIF
ncbi:MAG TPA: oligosaccharide flippase family protein [Thermosynechococcaceae cyanobacterium]